jgi:hypothetical protein
MIMHTSISPSSDEGESTVRSLLYMFLHHWQEKMHMNMPAGFWIV